MGKPKKSLFQFLCSLKLSISLLFLIVLVSITGTFIPQNLAREEYRKVFSPVVFKILDWLQIFDVYHSIWFISLLALFALNLILCSYKRFPVVWKLIQEPLAPQPVKKSERFLQYDFQIPARPEHEISTLLENFLGRKFTRPRKTSEGEKLCFAAQKGSWSRFAVFITHFSILIVLAGALIGSLWGFKAYVAIPEGQTIEKIRLKRSEKFIPLGFTVRCDDFTVKYYENSKRPKEFKSLVSIVDAEKVVVDHQSITVNGPLTYKGISFYQSSFGPASDPILHINVRNSATKKESSYPVTSGKQIPLSDGGFFRVLRFSPSFRDLGPVALIETISASGKAFTFPVFQNAPKMNQAHPQGEYSFTLTGFDQPYYTGLMVNRDPGVWFVWTGFILLTAGLLMAFVVSHRRIWVSITPRENMLQFSICGDSQRNPVSFERFFQDLTRALEIELSCGEKEET